MASKAKSRNPLTRAFVWTIGLYQKFISPLTGPTCRFYPSCSRYAVEALQVHGLFKGTYLAVWRLLRCNPWNLGGVDDVPSKRTK